MFSPEVVKRVTVEEQYTGERCYISELWNRPDDNAVSIAQARVEPATTTELHILDVDEKYVILDGRGRVTVDGSSSLVEPGDMVAIPAGHSQQIENIGDRALRFLCICTPRFRPESYRTVM